MKERMAPSTLWPGLRSARGHQRDELQLDGRYGDAPPQTVIVVGDDRDFVDRNFTSCELAGRLTNRYGTGNATIVGYDDVFVCCNLREPWRVFWEHFKSSESGAPALFFARPFAHMTSTA
jgi:hypothetical protein